MIRSLGEGAAERTDADVCIVGGGTVGLVVATRLARAGLRVVCLESGDRHQVEDEHELNAVVQAGSPYAGAAAGRFRCLGGTSTRWGGALIPFQAADMAGWPVSAEELAPYVAQVERLFGVAQGPYETGEPTLPRHVARLAKWPSFARRNVAALLGPELAGPQAPEVWLDATVTRFEVEAGRLAAVEARARGRASMTISARHFVLAAGAIESTRLALLLARAAPDAGFAASPHLGTGFQDHLSARVAALKVHDRRGLNRLVGFRFEGGGAMRNLRFELGPDSSLRSTVPPSFAHIGFQQQAGSGFDALRLLFQYIQRRRLPSPALMLRLARGAPWLARAVWWRFAERRLLYPGGADIELHMVIEQAATARNRITLDDGARDRFGQPLAVIDWRVMPADFAAMQAATDALSHDWAASSLARIATLTRYAEADVAAEMVDGGGIYHPTGSTRMGRDVADGVVDAELRLFGLDNVRVVATSVLPTGGGANPTMTLLMLGLRAADGLARALRP